MAKPVRIALVGGGFAAHFHLASYEKVYGVDFEVVGLFDILKDKAAHLAKERGVPRVYDSYEQLLADKNVDVVDVVVPNFLHVPTAVKAAQAGKHVFCEKPLTGYFGPPNARETKWSAKGQPREPFLKGASTRRTAPTTPSRRPASPSATARTGSTPPRSSRSAASWR